MIYKIECWRTLDGTLFDDEKAALAHQKRLDIKQRIRIFCNDLMAYGVTLESLEAELIAHMDELFDL